MKDYTPFGKEWQTEIMKMKKVELVGMLKKCLIEKSSKADLVAEIAKKLESDCGEHITMSGKRFYGISWAQIAHILGYSPKPPF